MVARKNMQDTKLCWPRNMRERLVFGLPKTHLMTSRSIKIMSCGLVKSDHTPHSFIATRNLWSNGTHVPSRKIQDLPVQSCDVSRPSPVFFSIFNKSLMLRALCVILPYLPWQGPIRSDIKQTQHSIIKHYTNNLMPNDPWGSHRLPVTLNE